MKKFFLLLSLVWLATCSSGSKSPTEPTQPPINPPTVQNIEITTAEDTSASFAFVGSDATGAAVTFSIVDNPVNGSITLNGNGGVYNPNANYYGGDAFSYKATSVNGVSNTATATITITSVNDTPNTSDTSATTDEDTAVEITLSATDIENDDLTFNVKNNPSNGTVSIDGNIATYTPNQDWNGTDTFNFEAVDSNNRTILNTATATIVVNPVNDAPVANNMTVSTDENRFFQLSITLDASDVDNDNLTYSIASDVSNGETSLNGNIVTYTPSQDYNGEDTFTYKANDGTVDSNTASVTITVNAVNDAPVTVNQTASTNEDEPISITLTATDIDSDTFSYSLESNTSNGTINLSNDVVTYTPNTNWNGTDTFTFKANDGTDDSNISTVTITVASVNDAPVVENIGPEDVFTYINSENGVEIELVASDIDGDNISFDLISSPSLGTVSLNGGVVLFEPFSNVTGRDTFTYTANDGILDSENIGTVTVDIRAYGETALYFDRDLSSGLEKSYVAIDLNQANVDNNSAPGGPFWWFNMGSETSSSGHQYSGANISFSLWIKPNGVIEDYATLVSRRSADNSKYFSLNLTDEGNILFKSTASSSGNVISEEWNLSDKINLSNEYWTHIFFSIIDNGNTDYLRLYVDGSHIYNILTDFDISHNVGRLAQDLLIGIERTDRSFNNGQYSGIIDNVLILQGESSNVPSLTASEVAELYNNRNQISNPIGYFNRSNSFVGSGQNIIRDYEIGFWKFNEGSGNTTDDTSAYDSSTSITGAQWITNQ